MTETGVAQLARRDAAQPARAGPLRRVGEACLWLLVVSVFVYAVARLAGVLRVVVLPVFLALVLSTLLAPPAAWLRRRGWRPAAAALTMILASLVVIGGLAAWTVPAFTGELGALESNVTAGLREVARWLGDGPFGLSQDQVGSAVDQLSQAIRDNASNLAGGVITGATVLLEVLAGLLLSAVILFFFLKDGARMWAWVETLVPTRHRSDFRGAGERAYSAVGSFVRAQTAVALYDATFIGLSLVITGVPLALPLTVLTFVAAYVPYIGAIAAGAAAVLVALVAQGLTTALIVLGAIVVVQQFEAHVITPLVLGRALNVHPLVIVVGVASGGVVGGIVGAVVATPVLAAASGVFAYFRQRPMGEDRQGGEDGQGGENPESAGAGLAITPNG